jgi:hypothetical protein
VQNGHYKNKEALSRKNTDESGSLLIILYTPIITARGLDDKNLIFIPPHNNKST